MRRISPDHIADWYEPYKLKGQFLYRGYPEYGPPAARIMNVSERTAVDKINQSRLSHEDTLKLAEGLNLSMGEYCEIFCRGGKFRDQE